jgi:hypothetical protein
MIMVASLLIGPLTTVATAYPSKLLPSSGIYFGSTVKRADMSQREALQAVESQIGRKFAIDHQYYQWNDNIPTAHQRWDTDTGRIPLINWRSGGPWREIANGSEDAWIRQRADAFADFGSPIYLAFHHEPENDLSRNGSPQDYAAAFRKIVTIFRSRGASNVGFVWNLMAWTFDPRSGRDPNQYYPGDSYVDFIGANGYNWYPVRSGDPYRPFGVIFSAVNGWAGSHGKPWIVCEYGSVEDARSSGMKPGWIVDALATAKTWSGLKALVYFDVHKSPYHWETNTSSSALSAYRQIARDPYANGTSSGGGQPSPSPSPNPWPSPSPSPSPPPPIPSGTLYNSLDGGPNWANIGSASTTGNAFSVVSTSDGGSLRYDNSRRIGSYSARHSLGYGSDSYYGWRGTRTVWYGRLYVWLDGSPPQDLRLMRGGSGDRMRTAIEITTDGRVEALDQDYRGIAITSRSVEFDRWVRIEWMVDHVRGVVQIRLFNTSTGTTPTDVVTSRSGAAIGSSADEFLLGRSGHQRFAITFWTDQPALSSSGYPR